MSPIKEAIEALEGLDEAYCRAGAPLTRDERTEDRKRLIKARAALAALRSMPAEPVAEHCQFVGNKACPFTGLCVHCTTPPPAPVLSDSWQPIETAPKDKTAILVSEGRFIHCVEWSDEYEWWAVDDNKLGPFRLRGTAPTHWMPLPPPPIEQAIGRASRGAK